MSNARTDPNYPDHKQRRLVDSWRQRSREAEENGDFYAAFISEWIAYNAFCLGLLKAEAIKMRADLRNPINVNWVGAEALGGSIITAPNGIKLNVESPCQFQISLKERYSEDLVFNAYVTAFKNQLEQAIAAEGDFGERLEALRASMAKGKHHYLVNMAKVQEWQPDSKIADQAGRGIVVLFEDCKPTTIKSVLYQVRCNIFHGEKVPGEPNDDRIVQAALPVLRHFFEVGLQQHF